MKKLKHKWQIEKNITNRYGKRLTALTYKELLQSQKKKKKTKISVENLAKNIYKIRHTNG